MISERVDNARIRKPERYRTFWVTIPMAAVIAVVAAACSSGAKVSASRSAPVRSGSADPNPPVVLAMSSAGFGEILTTPAGFALYTYTADEPGGMGCDVPCLKVWPPLLLPPGVTIPVGGSGTSGLGTFPRGDRLQVTFNGLPLYTFVKDTSPGQVTGQDVVDRAGKWVLATLSPAPTKASAAAAPAPTHPPAANAPAAAPAATHPPAANAPAAAPAATHPAAAQTPPATQPATTSPVTQPPITHPPITEPPVTQPPATDPPSSPPTTSPGLPAY